MHYNLQNAIFTVSLCVIFRQIYAKYKQRKRKKKENKKKNEDESKEDESTIDTEDEKDVKEDNNETTAFANSQFSLPESRPTTPGLEGRRRKSVVFEGEVTLMRAFSQTRDYNLLEKSATFRPCPNF